MPESQTSLLVDAVIYLAAAVVFVPLAKRVGLGSVLGYLAAGCLIGPFGLRFVQDVESIMHFAEFGVVLMLFAIGLELDPKRLWAMRSDVFRGGALQMGACGALLVGLFLALGIDPAGALVAGLALSLSSTASAMQTLAERNLTPTPMGRVSFAILLFQDIAAIPLIALVPLLAKHGSGAAAEEPGPWGALRVLAAIVAVVVIGRYLTRPVLRAVARANLREVFTAFALLLVTGIAQLMVLAGVSMGLGAFLAGVLLAGSEYRHALETDIEPFKGLLMGLFFMAVGMSIDFGLLSSIPLTIGALVLALLALKGAALALLARPLGVAPSQRFLFAALLAQGGEFAFVLLGLARDVRVLPGEWDARLTLVVALSMAVTPLLLVLQEKLHARSPARRSEHYDEIERQDAPVLIAGFGRFGQIIGRLLFASGVRATVLDHDPEQIELLRKFGFRVFYGDATRTDLLEAAGAGRARLLVCAIDDIGGSLELVDRVRQHFPALKIVARARNVTHLFELRRRGVEVVERETFESALSVGRSVLEVLGVDRYEARERADRFRRHNKRSLDTMMSLFEDEASRLSAARAGREELEQQFRSDMAALDRLGQSGWHEERQAEEEERASRVPTQPIDRF